MTDFPPKPESTKELIAIRKLLTALLVKSKLLTQEEVAVALGLDRSTVSRRISDKTKMKKWKM